MGCVSLDERHRLPKYYEWLDTHQKRTTRWFTLLSIWAYGVVVLALAGPPLTAAQYTYLGVPVGLVAVAIVLVFMYLLMLVVYGITVVLVNLYTWLSGSDNYIPF